MVNQLISGLVWLTKAIRSRKQGGQIIAHSEPKSSALSSDPRHQVASANKYSHFFQYKGMRILIIRPLQDSIQPPGFSAATLQRLIAGVGIRQSLPPLDFEGVCKGE